MPLGEEHQPRPRSNRWGRCRALDKTTQNARGWKWAYCCELDMRVNSKDCRNCELFSTEPFKIRYGTPVIRTMGE